MTSSRLEGPKPIRTLGSLLSQHAPQSAMILTSRKCSWLPLRASYSLPLSRLLLICLVLVLGASPCQGQSNPQPVTLSVPENVAENHYVGNIFASRNLNVQSFVILVGADKIANVFRVQGNGDVYAAARLDREGPRGSQFDLVIQAFLPAQIITVVSARLVILDQNDNSPTFDQPRYEASVREDAAIGLQVIGLPSAVDRDNGENSTQTYRITGGNVGEAFSVETLTGGDARALIRVNHLLNFETTARYELLIRAYDGGNRTGDTTLVVTVVDVNDVVPSFDDALVETSVPESVPVGTSVATVLARDPELGPFGEVEYELDASKSTPASQAMAHFAIGRLTGNITTLRKLDFEMTSRYELALRASNPGETAYGTAVVVVLVSDVNDNPPQVSLQSYYPNEPVAEGLGAGQRVALVTLSDQDTGPISANFSAELSGDEGFFTLQRDTATAYYIVTTRALDRESVDHFNLTVTVSDGGDHPLFTQASISLSVGDINDNDPEFVGPLPYEVHVVERAGPGVFVLHVIAKDDDEGDNSLVEYSLGPDSSAAGLDWFSLNSSTGVIVTRDGASPIDCGAASQPSLVVVARDYGTPPRSANTTVIVHVTDVNDNQPVFDTPFYEASVSENATVGSTCFLTVTATDGDCGINSEITYGFDTSSGTTAPNPFSVDGESGQLCLVSPVDYEDPAQRKFEFPVVAMDRGNESSSVTVKVSVTDVNDNVPVFGSLLYETSVSLSVSPGQPLRIVTATDQDSGDFGHVTYRLHEESDAASRGLFAVGAESGELSLSQSLGANPPSQYDVKVEAVDGGGLVSPQPTTVVVYVSTESNRPQFTDTLYNFELAEGRQESSALVGSVVANTPNGGSVTYSIVSGNDLGYFSLDPGSGHLTTVAGVTLDADDEASVLLSIQATTVSLPRQIGSSQVKVTFTDINDNAPQFFTNLVTLVTREDTNVSAALYQFYATDRDSNENGRVTFELLGDTDVFRLDPSGQLFLEKPLDYEGGPREYNLTVVARDNGTPVRLSSDPPLPCRVIVTDANDNPPTFDSSSYRFSVTETAPTVTRVEIGKITASDIDEAPSFIYRVTGSGDIGITAQTGELFSVGPLDRERMPSYTVTVSVSDGIWVAATTVIITVDDVNDNAPQFGAPEYAFTVSENSSPITEVGVVSASDPDLGPNGHVTYSLHSADFSVNSQSGTINTHRSLNREVKATYTLEVVAQDHGSDINRSTTVHVRVSVGDVNDNSPTFISENLMGIRVAENATSNTRITQLTATDPDEGPNAHITYSVARGSEWVRVSPHSGWLYTVGPLDRETQPTIDVTVIAQDGGSPPRSANTSFVVEVADETEQPTFPTSYVHISVAEDNPVTRSFYTVNATDSDAGTNTMVTYSLAGNDTFFRVDSMSGQLYNLYPFDREQVPAYELLVDAHDAGERAHTTRVNVSVKVKDANDHAPTFEQNLYIFRATENVSESVVVGGVQATDRDLGVNGEVTYSIIDTGREEGLFTIGRTSGVISTLAGHPLDYELQRMVALRVLARDHGEEPQSTRATVIVYVADVNDNAPVFLSRSQVFVREDEPVGFPVLLIVAVDADVNNKVVVTITGGDTDNMFQLNSTLGTLTLSQPLDREFKDSYQLVVTATDDGIPERSTSQTIDITVVDINDNPPKFTSTRYEAFVAENMPVGTSVLNVSASDEDVGDNALFTYMIPAWEDDTTANFRVTASGEILTLKEFDRENKDRYVFAVYVRGNAYPVRYDMAEVIVTVTDVNDHSPQFVLGQLEYTVPENLASGKVIFSVQAQDPDSGLGGAVLYSILAGNERGLFSINEFGTVSADTLDRETQAVHELLLEARDQGTPPRNTTTVVKVIVSDTNDNDPVFSIQAPAYMVSVYENVTVGELILTVNATDRDAGNNSKIQYYFAYEDQATRDGGGVVVGNPDSDVTLASMPGGEGLTVNGSDGKFSINPDTGALRVRGRFDREKTPRYIFDVVAIDGSEYAPRRAKRRVQVDVLDVNDNAPVFTRTYGKNITIRANAGDHVVTVEAEDKDEDENGRVTYRFVGDLSSYFSLRGDTGLITVASPPPKGLYYLEVEARDHGAPPLLTSTVVTINVNNEITTLYFSRSTYSVYLNESVPTGTDVVKVEAKRKDMATGTDALSAVEYAINQPQGVGKVPFTIEKYSGKITTATAEEGESLDFERQQRYHLTVVAVHGDTNAYCTVIVTLRDANDNAPEFVAEKYVLKVSENNPINRYITQVQAIDIDSGDNGRVTYSLLLPDKPPANQFHLYEKSGYLTAVSQLDRDLLSGDTIRLTVRARDNGTPRQTSTVTIKINVLDQNDVAPAFTSRSSITVRENTAVSKQIMQLSTVDPDLGPPVEYSFVSDQGNPGDYFSLDTFLGHITLKRPIDRETVQSMQLRVGANDSVHFTTQTIHVTVEDENDNTPIFDEFEHEISIPELMPVGTNVTRVHASDQDAGPNGEVRYSLDGDRANLFHMDSETGLVTLAQQFAYDPGSPVLQLIVRAVDRGSPPTNNVAFLHIKVRDINNFTPTFPGTEINVSLAENAAVGMSVVTVTARDDDKSPENRHIVYEILSGDPAGMFDMIQRPVGQQYSGEITLSRRLDRESVPSYTLVVMAKDAGEVPRNSTMKVIISLTDINDNPPVFGQQRYNITVLEGEFNRSKALVVVMATDEDDGPNGRITYTIHSGDSESKFGINQTMTDASVAPGDGSVVAQQTGSIFLNAPLDYERESEYELSVFATDRGVPPQDAYAIVHVHVIDVNEFPPRFTDFVLSGRVPENREGVMRVLQAMATDQDAGPFGVITYSLQPLEPSYAHLFSVDPSTGWVSARGPFDAEQRKSYDLKVFASDAGNNSQWVQMVVEVEDEDEYEPRFEASTYAFLVPYGADVGTVIGVVRASDLDGGTSGALIYLLKEGDGQPSENFAIGARTGQIYVKRAFGGTEGSVEIPQDGFDGAAGTGRRKKRSERAKREATREVTLVITATSGLPGSLSSSVTVNVTVTDYIAPPVTTGLVVTDGLQTGAPDESNLQLILIIVGVVVTLIILCLVIFFVRRRFQQQKAVAKGTAPLTGSHASSLRNGEFSPVAVDGVGAVYDPRRKSPKHLLERAATSASSGRGSAEFNMDEDMEIETITAQRDQVGRHGNTGVLGESMGGHRREPDSGMHEATTPELNCKAYLAGLGIDATKMDATGEGPGGPLTQSVESMHQFSEEGGGEDPLDMSIYRRLGAATATAGDQTDGGGGGEGMAPMSGGGNSIGGSSAGLLGSSSASPSQAGHGSLSNVTDASEELAGSYSWDYLLDWSPRYTTLAHVFTEIARLKDDSVQPRTMPVRTVPQQPQAAPLQRHQQQHLHHRRAVTAGGGGHHSDEGGANGVVRSDSSSSRFKPPGSKIEPPPIITGAPPKAAPLSHHQHHQYAAAQGRLGAGGGNYHHHHHQHQQQVPPQHSFNSARTSQLTSMTSLARSPVSHESSFSNLAFATPGAYTPAWTPLARSPSISTLQSGQTTPPLGGGSSVSSHHHLTPLQQQHQHLLAHTTVATGEGLAETEFPIL